MKQLVNVGFFWGGGVVFGHEPKDWSRGQGTTKVIRDHLLGTLNDRTKFYVNP